MDTSTLKGKLARFGRSLALLLGRGLMYQASHPMVRDSVNELHKVAELIFPSISPLVFILNREQFYVDEEMLDPRVNVKRIATLFKTHGIQSVSFEEGLKISEIDIFIDIFSSMTISTDAEAIKDDLFSKGAFNIKINHVTYKKVTEDDQIISREALKDITPDMDSDDQESRKKFMDTLLESVLAEEFANTLNIQSLLANPAAVSKNMIKADMASAQQIKTASSVADVGPGGGTGSGGGSDSGTGSGPSEGAGPGYGGSSGSVAGIDGGIGTTPGMAHGTGRIAQGGTTGGDAAQGFGPGGGGSGVAGSNAAIDGGVGTVSEGGGDGIQSASDSMAGAGTGAVAGDATGPTSEEGGHGPMLIHQLEMLQREVDKQLKGQGDLSLTDLAEAVVEMKKRLFEDIQTQKAIGIAYANENVIIQNANKLTDKVLVKLVQEEYKAGKITTPRLAQIILRLIPDAQDLKRLLPQIKIALLAEGMSPEKYLDLIQELKNELQSEDLVRILEESSETIGVDGEGLIDELKQNPDQAAKLIYLASEIRKGTGDESALADILVDYVEQLSSQKAMDAGGKDPGDGDEHLKTVVTDVESTIMNQLGQMNLGDDVLKRMEGRINDRMESILDKMRVEWLNTQTRSKKVEKHSSLSVLQTLEHNVGRDEELRTILQAVRTKFEAGDIEENNFSQIQEEITRQKQRLKEEADGKEMPDGVLKSDELMFILEKEVARANRYNAPFSALAFSLVKAKPTMKSLQRLVTTENIMTAALEKLSLTFREVDYIGQIGKNKIVAILPMVAQPEAKLALSRVMALLHAKPLDVNEVPVQLRVAGVVTAFSTEHTKDVQAFAKQLSNQLTDMVARIKNIQVLF